MKLVFHSPAHRKNTDGITLMCKAFNIDLEFTTSWDRVKRDDYDILIMNEHFIEPTEIPSRIKIIYGPQHWVFPQGSIRGPLDPVASQRCVFNTLSKWNTVRLLEHESIRVPYVEFPFAVDIHRFRPDESKEKSFDCLVYYKHRQHCELDTVLKTLEKKGFSYKRLHYGSYNENDYLQLLQSTKFMVVLDAHESQGFALEEAMSCNVPLLVLDAISMYDEHPDGATCTYQSKKPLPLRATSVPYWSDECGIRITSFLQLQNALERMMSNYSSFAPRRFIERELSPEKCMRNILDYFQMNSS